MALLEEVLDRPPDPGYHSAAEQRVRRGLPASTGTGTLLMAVTALVLGLVLATAARELRTPDPEAAQARAELVHRIEDEQQVGDAYAEQIEALRDDLAALERAAISGGGQGQAEQVAEAARLAGASALEGPGVVVTLEDAPRPRDSVEPADPAERVLSRDLQLVVNGLWRSGGEAIDVNGHRLSSTSAIRFAGEAIIVDFRALAPPYTLRAIGDQAAMAEELGSGPTGAYLDDLRTEYGIIVTVRRQDSITVPSASRLTTRVADVPEPVPEEESE